MIASRVFRFGVVTPWVVLLTILARPVHAVEKRAKEPTTIQVVKAVVETPPLFDPAKSIVRSSSPASILHIAEELRSRLDPTSALPPRVRVIRVEQDLRSRSTP